MTHLKAGGAPVNKLYGSFVLDGVDGSVDVVGVHVATVQEAAGHVLSVPRVTLDHLVGRLETHVCDGGRVEVAVVCLGGGYDGCVRDEREVDTGVRH